MPNPEPDAPLTPEEREDRERQMSQAQDEEAGERSKPGGWYVSSFEIDAGGTDRVVMGGDGFMVARLMGRSEAEHDALAKLIVEAVNAHPSPTPAADADRVLVPLEPTPEMHAAGVAVTEKKLAPSWTALEVYRAMTRAALKSTAAKEGEA